MSTIIGPAAQLAPAERAAFATTARLVSCLVTESLVRALYYPLAGFEATGFSVVLSGDVSSDKSSYASQDILAIVLLLYIPVFKHNGIDPRGREIGLLDPLDMLPLVFEIAQTQAPDVITEDNPVCGLIFSLPGNI